MIYRKSAHCTIFLSLFVQHFDPQKCSIHGLFGLPVRSTLAASVGADAPDPYPGGILARPHHPRDTPPTTLKNKKSKKFQ